ncbi:MAG: hypothetical protein OXC60_04640, partial [Litoreibacter sp.]|nr:hypothetical protein [Litoreibacter sp.]
MPRGIVRAHNHTGSINGDNAARGRVEDGFKLRPALCGEPVEFRRLCFCKCSRYTTHGEIAFDFGLESAR